MQILTSRFWARIIPLMLLIQIAGTILISSPAGPQITPGGNSQGGNSRNASAATAQILPGEFCAMPEGGTWTVATLTQAADLPAVRQLSDPFPTFSEVAVDAENNRVVITDINRKSVLIYDRSSGGASPETTAPVGQVLGPDTMIGFVAGVDVDPVRREIFAVNNDIEDTMAVFAYGQGGNAKPARVLVVPHQSWGLSLAHQREEIAISVQQVNAVFIYRREASGVEPPVRTIQGPSTGLADPHGIFVDEQHQEILVANHGNWRNEYTEDRPQRVNAVSYRGVPPGGKFLAPSIAVYPLTANGDMKPIRVIQGPRAGLNYPMALDVDLEHDEIFLANNGDNSILVFSRTGAGDQGPVRVIRGDRTGLDMPIGIALDTKNDELWVTNSNSHAAVVFPRSASGNVSPKRTVRNAPASALPVGFTNPMALGYDSKRNEILVPN